MQHQISCALDLHAYQDPYITPSYSVHLSVEIGAS